MQSYVLGLIDHTHAAAAELLDDAVVRDNLADHAQECYGGSVGKSMKAVELMASQAGLTIAVLECEVDLAGMSVLQQPRAIALLLGSEQLNCFVQPPVR